MNRNISNFLYFVLSPVLGKKFFQPFFEKLFLFSLAGMNYGLGSPGNSGERFVLKYLQSKLKLKSKVTIFDIGANKGEYTENVLDLIGRRSIIYGIEPLQTAYLLLRKKFTGNKQVKVFNLGFSDKQGRAPLYFDIDSSVLASLYQRKAGSLGLPASLDRHESITLSTVDLFCRKNKISHINLLKIDTEGHELKVLHGATKMLKQNKIDYIQFEFAGTMVDSRTFFRDLFIFLNPGFKIYRILQDGLSEIKHCDEKQEIFFVSNFLAVNRNLI